MDILVPATMITLGLIDLFRKDLAWKMTEWALRSVNPQRTSQWEHDMTINGVLLLAFGLAWLAFLVIVLIQQLSTATN